MAETTPRTRKANSTSTEFADASKTGPIDTAESHPGGEHTVPWAAGFVTAEGAHIPLFIPPAPRELGSA